MNLKALHYVAIALGLAVIAAQYLAGQVPAFAGAAHAVAAICGALLPVLGALSPSAVDATNIAAAKRAAAKAGTTALLVVLGGLTVHSLSGCAWFQAHPPVAGDLQAIEECAEKVLATDATTNETPEQVGIDLAVACGPDVGKVLVDALAKTANASGASKAAVLRAARR